MHGFACRLVGSSRLPEAARACLPLTAIGIGHESVMFAREHRNPLWVDRFIERFSLVVGNHNKAICVDVGAVGRIIKYFLNVWVWIVIERIWLCRIGLFWRLGGGLPWEKPIIPGINRPIVCSPILTACHGGVGYRPISSCLIFFHEMHGRRRPCRKIRKVFKRELRHPVLLSVSFDSDNDPLRLIGRPS